VNLRTHAYWTKHCTAHTSQFHDSHDFLISRTISLEEPTSDGRNKASRRRTNSDQEGRRKQPCLIPCIVRTQDHQLGAAQLATHCRGRETNQAKEPRGAASDRPFCSVRFLFLCAAVVAPPDAEYRQIDEKALAQGVCMWVYRYVCGSVCRHACIAIMTSRAAINSKPCSDVHLMLANAATTKGDRRRRA